MRARGVVVLIVLTIGLGACGRDGASNVGTTRALPKLPGAAANGGASTMEARSSAAPAADMAIYPARPVEYRLAPGVKAPAASAPAYRVVAREVSDEALVRMAGALGLRGPIEREGQSRLIRSGDAELRLDGGPVHNWSYSRQSKGAISSTTAVACAPDTKCEAAGPLPPRAGLPSATQAEAKTRGLLDAMGIEPGPVSSPAHSADDPYQRVTTWTTETDGVEVIGLGGSIAFGEQAQVDYAGGSLAALEKVGDYALVSMEAAVERLQSGAGGGMATMTAEAPAEQVDPATEANAPSGGGGVASDPGSASDQPVEEPGSEPITTLAPRVVGITGARVVLMVTYGMCPDDPVYAVPSFAFTPEEAGTVVAVEDSALDTGTTSGPAGCPGIEPAPDQGVKPEPVPMPPDAPQSEPVPADR